MITFSKLGKHGNLGNQLFEIASTIGIAVSNGVEYKFPKWHHSKSFKIKLPMLTAQEAGRPFMLVNEPHFHYSEITIDAGRDIDLLGWLQSEKYWLHCENQVLKYFQFTNGLITKVKSFMGVFDSGLPVCAIGVRRGDYVGNQNYEQLDMNYYLGGALKIVEQCGPVQFLVFSDDITWCRKNFPETIMNCGVLYTPYQTAIEQMAQMSCCDHFVIANSTFSWWGAYLGEKRTGGKSVVIAPARWNAGALLQTADDKDLVPARWIKYDVYQEARKEFAVVEVDNKYDLRDVTFTIPVKRDSADRAQNLELCIDFLQYYFHTNIIVGEMDESMQLSHMEKKCDYRFWKINKLFRRTWMLNQMAREAQTPIVANWDCDVFADPKQIAESVERIRSGELEGCYPYDGRNFRAPRERMYQQFRATLAITDFKTIPYPKYQHTVTSYGNAVIWNKAKFFEGGAENENFEDYGPEDYERWYRFNTLGYRVGRVKGPIFHMDHDEEKNGSKGHEKHKFNHEEYERLKRMSKLDMQREVQPWKWRKMERISSLNDGSVSAELSSEHPLRRLLKPDKIFCINLKSRPDKLKHAMGELERVGLYCVTKYEAIDGYALQLKSNVRQLSPGMLGCYQTHQRIIRSALENGFERIVILEDDIELIPGFNEFMNVALPQIPEDWEFIYLGAKEYGGPMDFVRQVNEFWVIPKAVWGTQAYAIRGRSAMMKILNHLELMKMQLDNQYCQEVLPNSGVKYYMIFPSAVGQWQHLSSDVQVENFELKFG